MVNSYLQGRKIAIEHNGRLPPIEIVHLIRKLRWIGMDDEVEPTSDENAGSYPDRRCHHCRARNGLATSLLQARFCLMGRQLHEFRKPVQTFCGSLY
jgi:hypothetical protein